MTKIALREVWYQFVQHAVSPCVFNLPPLLQVRASVYRRLFGGGRGCCFAHHVYFERHHGLTGALTIGEHVVVGHDVTIDCTGGVTLDDHVWISEGSLLFSHDHRFSGRGLKVECEEVFTRPLTVGRDAWIGAHCIILPQVERIGEGAMVGAGSVVTKPVAPFTIVAGNPARVIGERGQSREATDGSQP